MNWRLRSFDSVSSTNEVIKEALRTGEAEGLVVSARRQSGGYGRQGRSWASPEGGLYLSLLLRPDVAPSQLPTLSLVVGLAVRDALAPLVAPEFSEKIQVKWPNDVVFAEDAFAIRKLCGISLESLAGGVCVGIGVNVFKPQAPTGRDSVSVIPRPLTRSGLESLAGSEMPEPESRPVFGKNEPCFLEDLGFPSSSVSVIRDTILDSFPPLYARWLNEGFAPFVSAYSGHALLAGKTVVIEDLDGRILTQGTVVGIDGEGRLLVEDSDGLKKAVASGEAHIVFVG